MVSPRPWLLRTVYRFTLSERVKMPYYEDPIRPFDARGYYIYALYDPSELRRPPYVKKKRSWPRYVGMTKNLSRRLEYHCRDSSRNKSLREKWISRVLATGKRPVMVVLWESNERFWKQDERYWIAFFRASVGGYLLNFTDGGDTSVKGKYVPYDRPWNKPNLENERPKHKEPKPNLEPRRVVKPFETLNALEKKRQNLLKSIDPTPDKAAKKIALRRFKNINSKYDLEKTLSRFLK